MVVVAVSLGAPACRSRNGLSEPPKEVAKLGDLIGKWKSTSRRLASNLRANTSDMELTFECQWTLDKYYVSCLQTGEINGKKVKEADVFGYSEQARLYTMTVVVDVEDVPLQVYSNWFAWEGNIWRFLPRDGIRSTWELKSPDLHITQTERSVDGVWVVSSTGQHTRIP